MRLQKNIGIDALGVERITGFESLRDWLKRMVMQLEENYKDSYDQMNAVKPRDIAANPTLVATAGNRGEIVYSSTTEKWYGKTTSTGTDTNWSVLN